MAALLAGYRAKYYRFKNITFKPLRKDEQEQFKELTLTPRLMDVHATLQALAEIPDAGVDKAIRLLDSETYTHLKRAAYLDYRREHPKPDPIPPDALLIRKVIEGRVCLAISPQRLRELAALALSELPKKDAGGRPPIDGLNHLFACALVHHWIRIKGTTPSAHEVSPFAKWAAGMFKRVGAPARSDYREVLRSAIEEVI